MSHDLAMELVTAGAILGDLDPEERLTYAAHRRWCLDCRRLERDLDGVMVDLSLAAPRREAPPHLLAAVLGEIRGEGLAGAFAGPAEADVEPTGDRGPGGDAVPGGDPGRNVAASPAASGVAATGAASRVVAWRRRRPLAASLALVAVLAVVVAGLGARDIARQQELNAARASVVSLEAALAGRDGAMTVAMDPGRVSVALHPESVAPSAQAAVVYLPGTANAWIVARNLPSTPSGQAYQLWFADATGVHPLQVVRFDGQGAFIAPIDVDLDTAAAVMITLEPAAGSGGDPGPQVVFGEL